MRSELGREARLLVAAVQLLTRLPVPAVRYDPDWLPGAAKYFPLVGLAIGGLAAAVLAGASHVWPAPIPALLAVGAAILATGAFHEDGLADSADGLGAAGVAARLAVMRDSRLGTFGAVALGLALALRVAALAAMPIALAVPALVAAHAGARFAALPVMRWTPYAGDPADAKTPTGRPSPAGLAVGALIGLAPFAWLPAAGGASALLLGALGAAFVARLLCRGLGGHTGDVLGAVTATFETAALLGAAAVLAP